MALAAVDKLGSVFRGADLEASLSVLAVNMANKVGPYLRLTTTCESLHAVWPGMLCKLLHALASWHGCMTEKTVLDFAFLCRSLMALCQLPRRTPQRP